MKQQAAKQQLETEILSDTAPDLTGASDADFLRMTAKAMQSPASQNAQIVMKTLTHLRATQIELAQKEAELEKAREKLADQAFALEEQKQLTAAYKKKSRTEPMTGLLNRRGFEKEVSAEFNRISRGQSAGALILIFDINYLNWVNGAFGHKAGDKLLNTFAQTLKDFERESDSVCRHGGDEFTMCLSNVDQDHIPHIVNRLEDHISNVTFEHGGHTLPVRAMFDISYVTQENISSDHASSLEAHITDADIKLMKRKEARPTRGSSPPGFEHISLRK